MGLGRLAAAMTVGQKAALSVAIGLLGFAAAVAVTALVVSPKAALAIWSGVLAILAAAVLLSPIRTCDLAPRPRPDA